MSSSDGQGAPLVAISIRLSHPSGAELSAEIGDLGLVLGRSERNSDLSCPWDTKMSRRHGRIWQEQGVLWYEDLQSSNGSWSEGALLTDKIALGANTTIRAGDTKIYLGRGEETTIVRDGMTIHLSERVSRQDFAGALSEAGNSSEVLQTLASFVDRLLGTAELADIAPCLRSLYDHLSTARNIYLIASPQGQAPLEHLIDPALLAKDSSQVGVVSRSLARLAVERGEALFFCQSSYLSIEVRETTSLKGIHSAAYIPLLSSDGSTLGILCVDSPQSALPLHALNAQLLKSAAALIAARLDGEKLRQEAQQRKLEARALESRRESLANFLKIASHDLKNPLTVVKMCGFLIDRLSEDETISGLCKRLLDAEVRAERLISSYLEISEIESAQELRLTHQVLNLHDLVEEEFLFLEKALSEKNMQVEFKNEIPSVMVRADQQKLAQILSNLIGNAIKYGSEKAVVRVRYSEDDNFHHISVEDNGIGISDEDQKKLFAQFQRLGEDRSIPGTGLGLWLSNALVQAHGGTMSVESRPGEGSSFSFTLPKAAPHLNR